MQENQTIGPMLAFLTSNLPQPNPHYTELFFERLLPKFTLNKELWYLYLKLGDESKLLCRALKNLYLDAELWCRYALSLEQTGHSGKDIRTILEQSLGSDPLVLVHIYQLLCRTGTLEEIRDYYQSLAVEL